MGGFSSPAAIPCLTVSETRGWRLGDTGLGEYLDRYQGQRLVLIIAPVGAAEQDAYTSGICGLVMNETGRCPRCELAIKEQAQERLDTGGSAPM